MGRTQKIDPEPPAIPTTVEEMTLNNEQLTLQGDSRVTDSNFEL